MGVSRLALALLIGVGACVTPKPPAVPVPSIPATRYIRVTIRGAQDKPPVVNSVLLADDFGHVLPCHLEEARATCTVTGTLFFGVQGYLVIDAIGYQAYRGAFYLTGTDTNLNDITLTPLAAPLRRLAVRGRFFELDSGESFDGPAATDFNLYARYLTEGPDAIAPVVQQRADAGIRIHRVFTWFSICPDGNCPPSNQAIGRLIPREHQDYYLKIPEFLAFMAQYGQYVEFTAFSGNSVLGGVSDEDKIAHWEGLKAAVAGSPNALLELVNEGDDARNNAIPFPRLTPPSPPTLASRGSGTQDHVFLPIWTHTTWHPAGGDSWQRKPGHNAWEVSVANKKPVYVNESTRCCDQDSDPTHWFDVGANCKLFGVICNFHSVHGKSSQLWDARELAAAQALKAGVESVPDTCKRGNYLHRTNLENDQIIRAYEMTGVGTGCVVTVRK